MKVSAGILMFRKRKKKIQFLLVHPGGPYFIKKQEGVWSIPKGEFTPDEEPLTAAIREFEEETGYKPSGNFIELNSVTQKGGKKVLCWAVEDDLNHENITSNTFEMEWPPNTGKMKSFPEIDEAGWFDMDEAMQLINEKQIPLLEELLSKMGK
ncbi:MAG: NUDIX domain-containing protein [Taibaiella sp.]|jgi:predicted NUDIX family NTP pyrophosphohydrolase